MPCPPASGWLGGGGIVSRAAVHGMMRRNAPFEIPAIIHFLSADSDHAALCAVAKPLQSRYKAEVP